MPITTTAYNSVNMSNMSSFQSFINLVNDSGGGWVFTMINFLVFAVIFITLTAGFGWESAILSAGFIGLILSLLFVYMGVMNIWIAGMFVGIIIIAFLIARLSDRYD